jgi:hypothetical protein
MRSRLPAFARFVHENGNLSRLPTEVPQFLVEHLVSKPFISAPVEQAGSGIRSGFVCDPPCFVVSLDLRIRGSCVLFMQHQEKRQDFGQRDNILLERFWFAGLFGRLVRPSPSFFILVFLLGWPSVWFLAKIPVLWNYMDGFLQISSKPGAANLLVWPPLYCFGARFPMLIGYLIGGGTIKGALRYISHPVLTNSAVLTLIITQHLAFLGASLVFIRTISKKTYVQIVLALIFSSFSFLYATVHTVGSESGSVILILLIAAFSLEIARSSQLNCRRWILLSALLSAAVLTRHINAVMLLLPIFAAALPRLKDGRSALEACRNAASRALVALAAGVTALALANCLVWLCCLCAKVDHRSMVGLTFLARIDQLRNTPGRFSEFVDEMVDHVSDPVLVETLQRLKLANEAHQVGPDFITEAKATIEEVSSAHGALSPGQTDEHRMVAGSSAYRPPASTRGGLSSNAPSLRALMDEKFNALTTATLLTEPASFRQAVVSDWLEGQNWLCGFFTHCSISGTAIDWDNDPLGSKMQPLHGLATFSNFSFADLNALEKNFTGPFLADEIAVWHLVVAICILSVVAGILRVPAWNTATAVSMLVVGELVYLLSCCVAGQVWRYGIPFLELVLCAALTQVAGILDVLLGRIESSKLENK